MQAGLDAIGDHAGAVAVRGGWRGARDPQREEQADAVRTAEVEILANDSLEEVAALHRLVEDVREAHFELADREAVVIAGGAVGRGHRPGQPMRPAIEEGLHVGRPERVAGRLQRRRVGTVQKAVVETLEAHPLATEVLLHPLVPVEAELDRIRQVRADLEERRAPVAIVHVEVVVVDGDGLAREIEGNLRAGAGSLVRLERAHLLLRHADDDDALAPDEALSISRDYVVLPLLGLEGDQWDRVASRKRGDRGHEAIMERLEERGRGNRVAEVFLEEVAEPARRLELGHPRMQIQAIDAPNLERHVLADNGGDVGRHQNPPWPEG